MRAFWWGFTLAEVLITLMIIGIIAALTIPSLMTKVQDHGFRSAFLKNYALIKNAYAKSMSDGVPFWDPAYTKEQNWTISPTYIQDPNLMKNYFKIQKGPYFIGGGNGFMNFPNIYVGKTATEIYQSTFKHLDGSYVNPFLLSGSAFTFQLTDGTVISFCMWSSWIFNIFIDVNGPTGPNTYGRDIYWLQAPWDNALGRNEIHPMGDKHTGWINYTEIGKINNEFTNTCQTGGKTSNFRYKYSGSTCAYEIVKNRSYKIPKE